MEIPISDDRAAKRFYQIRAIARALDVKASEIADCKDHLKDLHKQYDGLLEEMRGAARDQGELMLVFDGVEAGVAPPIGDAGLLEADPPAEAAPA